MWDDQCARQKARLGNIGDTAINDHTGIDKDGTVLIPAQWALFFRGGTPSIPAYGREHLADIILLGDADGDPKIPKESQAKDAQHAVEGRGQLPKWNIQ